MGGGGWHAEGAGFVEALTQMFRTVMTSAIQAYAGIVTLWKLCRPRPLASTFLATLGVLHGGHLSYYYCYYTTSDY